MLVDENGLVYGTIGGGSVEFHAIQRARECIRKGRTLVLNYDLKAAEKPKPDSGDMQAIDGEEILSVSVAEKDISVPSITGSAEKVVSGAICSGTLTVLFEVFKPRPKLVIAGAGHISQHLASFAVKLDYEVVVVDPLSEFANETRFPGCTIQVGPFEQVLGQLESSINTYFVIVTRGHTFDRASLKAVIGKPSAYVGMIGSVSKIKSTYKSLIEEGVPEEMLRKVHAPIGLDIGGDSPEEIALAIISEIQLVRYSGMGATGTPLFEKRHKDLWE